MASLSFVNMYRRSQSTSRCLILVLLMAIAPFASIPLEFQSEVDSDYKQFNFVDFSEGSGDELIGETLILNNSDWTVRAERGFDEWSKYQISNSSNITANSLILDDLGRMHGCWTEGSNGLWMFRTEENGSISSQQVNDSAVSDGCALAMDDQDNLFITFLDDAGELHLAREAKKGSMNFNRVFLTRALIGDHVQMPLNIGFTDGMHASIIWKSANDSTLWMTRYSGTNWNSRQLVNEPVGVDVEMEVDASGMIHVAYTSGNDVRLLRFNDSFEEDKVLLREESDLALARLGFTLDSTGNPQVSFEGSGGEAMLLRSLSGQSTGRIEPVPMISLDLSNLDEDSLPQLLSDADFNADGLDDMVFANPSENKVLIVMGSAERNNFSNPTNIQTLTGVTGENFGQSITAGDFNGDGFDDLVIGAPQHQIESNITGIVYLHAGSASGLNSSESWNWSLNSDEGETGFLVSSAGDVDGDGDDELLIVSSNHTTVEAEKGRVDMFLGSLAPWGNESSWSLSGSTIDAKLGMSIAGDGDVNGDGYADIAISSTGSKGSPFGYGAVHIFHGGSTAISSQPQTSIKVDIQGNLFGYHLAWVDLDGNGFDELLVGEPFNGSAYQSGLIWIFNGTSTGLEVPQPLTVLFSSQVNDHFGSLFESAGDVNEDGYEDLLVSQRDAGRSGKLSLYLGSENGILTSTQTIAKGSAEGDWMAAAFSTKGDLDGDGMLEVMVLEFDDFTQNGDGSLHALTERDWSTTSLEVDNSLIDDIEVGISYSGALNIMLDGPTPLLLQHMDDGTAEGHWLQRSFTSLNDASMSTTVSGAVSVLVHDSDGLYLMNHSSRQLVHQTTITTGNIGAWADIEIDQLNNPSIIHARVDTSEIYWTRASSSGWSNSMVSSGIDLVAPLTQIVDSDNEMWVILTNDADDSLTAYNRPVSSWNSNGIVAAGDAVGSHHSARMLSNGSLAVLSIVDDDGSDSLNLSILDGSTLSTEALNIMPNRDARFVITEVGNNLHIAWQNATGGECVGMSRALNGSNWTRDWELDINSSTTAPLVIIGSGTSQEVQCSNSTSGTDTLVRLENNASRNMDSQMESSTIRRSLMISGSQYYLISNGSDIILRNTDRGIGSNLDTVIAGLSTNHGDFTTSPDGVIHLVFQDAIGLDLVMFRLLPDFDGDRIPDILDEMPLISGQWEDSDGDGFGDNPDGPAYDHCSSGSGTSIVGKVGCGDFDGDMVADLVDACSNKKGLSYFDRLGCQDYDRDGWSNNDATWVGGDQYPFNWKQQRDSDGDGYGDNNGPDCCITYWPDTNYTENHAPDLFPSNKHQWKDSDGDGYGDNVSHSSGDDCDEWFGNSSLDRNGCPDSDGDGYSNPGAYKGQNWDAEDGADAYVNDSTQWADTDGDGYGDNKFGNNPDHFINNSAAANDSDMDGYPNNWTAMYNGSNQQNLSIDSCPLVWGDSTEDLDGCPDRDGDGWSDLGDKFPDEISQWNDSDNDGWGDNAFPAYQPDACPYQAGIVGGTGGDGCPLVVEDDEDLDSVIDSLDQCPNTPEGESVDTLGCSWSQLDDDNDGETNGVDDCPETPEGENVDERGCTVTQAQTDTDNDNVTDPNDKCKNTPEGESVDNRGCSDSQKDDDSDLVSNAIDQCPGTPIGAEVDELGCIVEGADSDGDGVEDVDDLFPGDSSQWISRDGDAFGDNLTGTQGDACPDVPANSTEDRFGCPDRDEDGYSDGDLFWTVFSGADAFPDDSTQWKDSDNDGVGDNASSSTGDKCPSTAAEWRHLVDETGCDPTERDSDSDGVVDMNDNCPDTKLGDKVDVSGCMIAGENQGQEESTSGNMDKVLIYGGAGLGGLVLLIIISILIGSRGGVDLGDEEDEDDWVDDDDADDDSRPSFSSGRESRNSSPARGPTQAPSRGPGPAGGQPSRGPRGGPPMDRASDPYGGGGYDAPPTGGGGYGFTAPSPSRPRAGPPVDLPPVKKATKKKILSPEEIEAAKQEEIRQQNWEPEDEGPLFDDEDAVARQDSVAWAWDEIQISTDDRSIMMTLQGSGWSAKQSRAILSEAKAW